MLEIGYDVIYSKAHWEWLHLAGRVRKADKRTQHVGLVVGLEAPEVVVVRWNAGRPFPVKEDKRTFPEHVRHLAENLIPVP